MEHEECWWNEIMEIEEPRDKQIGRQRQRERENEEFRPCLPYNTGTEIRTRDHSHGSQCLTKRAAGTI